MLNNPILDVVIGLCFLYVVYSLLATILKEFIATLFSYRPRMLEVGIQQMLDGHQISYYWWDRLVNQIIWLTNFLVWHAKSLRQKPTEPDPGNMRAFLAPKPIAKGQNHPYRRYKLNAKAKMFASRITTHDLFKRSGEINWIKGKKPAYLPADTFSDILIDILGSHAKQGGDTRLILMKDISHYIHAHIKDNPGLVKILSIYSEQANGDVTKFKGLINKWYDDTMDRVSGWYKRQANLILLFIGLILALAFNVDTIQIVKKLSTDKNARSALVQSAAHYIDSQYAKDQQTVKGDSGDIKTRVKAIQDIYNGSIDSVNTLLGLGWTDKPLPSDAGRFWTYWHRTISPAVFLPIYNSWSSPLIFLGFLLTALAISLGAPFWFDLLNKLVNLRASGTKPDKSNATPVNPLLNKPDPTAKG